MMSALPAIAIVIALLIGFCVLAAAHPSSPGVRAARRGGAGLLPGAAVLVSLACLAVGAAEAASPHGPPALLFDDVCAGLLSVLVALIVCLLFAAFAAAAAFGMRRRRGATDDAMDDAFGDVPRQPGGVS